MGGFASENDEGPKDVDDLFRTAETATPASRNKVSEGKGVSTGAGLPKFWRRLRDAVVGLVSGPDSVTRTERQWASLP